MQSVERISGCVALVSGLLLAIGCGPAGESRSDAMNEATSPVSSTVAKTDAGPADDQGNRQYKIATFGGG